jgi:hypothetical protein
VKWHNSIKVSATLFRLTVNAIGSDARQDVAPVASSRSHGVTDAAVIIAKIIGRCPRHVRAMAEVNVS